MTCKILGLLILTIGVLIPIAYADAPSPLQQWNDGTPLEQIQCNADKILMEKDGKPACLSEYTVPILEERGYLIVRETLLETLQTNTKHGDTTEMPDEDNVKLRYASVSSNRANEHDSVKITYPKPDIEYELPSRFVINEPVTLRYTYQYDKEDHDAYLFRLEHPIPGIEPTLLFNLEFPDEFTTDVKDSKVVYGDLYTTHTTKRYKIHANYTYLGSGSGEVIITLTKEMMYDYDVAHVLNPQYNRWQLMQVIKTEYGAELKTEEQLGMPVKGTNDNDPGGRIDQQVPIYTHVGIDGIHTPDKRPQPQVSGESDHGSKYINPTQWPNFVKFLALEQSVGYAQNVTEYLLREGMSEQFINDFLEAYPEL